MKLSLISPMYRADSIDAVLQSYVDQDANKNDYEIIFLVTNSEVIDIIEKKINQTRDRCKLNWTLYKMPGLSNCESRNQGVQRAYGNIVLFADGDQTLSSNTISEHIKAIKKGYVGMGIVNINVTLADEGVYCRVPLRTIEGIPAARDVFFSQMHAVEFTKRLCYTHALAFADLHNKENLTDYINVVTRNCSFWKKDFIRIGGFDEELGFSAESGSRGWEDLEIGIRAEEHKLKFKFIPCWAVHINHGRMNKDKGWDNILKVMRKHPWFLEKREDWFAIRYPREEVRRRLLCGG